MFNFVALCCFVVCCIVVAITVILKIIKNKNTPQTIVEESQKIILNEFQKQLLTNYYNIGVPIKEENRKKFSAEMIQKIKDGLIAAAQKGAKDCIVPYFYPSKEVNNWLRDNAIEVKKCRTIKGYRISFDKLTSGDIELL